MGLWKARAGLLPALVLVSLACGPPRPRPADRAAREAREQPPPGVFHRVRAGQTLFTIARTYGVELAAIVEANDIENPDRIDVDQMLFIPGARQVLDVPPTALPGGKIAGLFRMPVTAPVTSSFGRRHGRMHYGIDLGAAAGTEVHAARAGVVSYAGHRYRGYGNLIILDHGDGYQTLYAHNRRLLVQAGRRVQSGETIARVGATGNATAPHLHFEIRKDGHPLDPARFLPL